MHLIKLLWIYRYFILSSIRTEFKGRFVRSKLGGLWMILHPLAHVAIFAFILSSVLSAKIPGVENRFSYGIFIMSGTLAWNLFAEVVSRCVNLFVDNGNLIKKLSFPKITLPAVVIGSSLVNSFFLLCAIFVIFGLLGHIPGLNVLWLPFLAIILLGMSTGLGIFLAIINVFIRDVAQIVTILLQLWFWLTPVVYMYNIIPAKFQGLLFLNPMTGIVLAYQNILLFKKPPEFPQLIYPSIFSIFFLCVAYLMYIKGCEEMADAL